MAAENKVPNRQSKAVKTSSKRVTTPSTPKKIAPKVSPATVSAAAAVVRRRTRKPVESKQITAEERLRYIEMAAYYIAEKRGFAGGDPAQDWNMAEQQVDNQLLAGHLPN